LEKTPLSGGVNMYCISAEAVFGGILKEEKQKGVKCERKGRNRKSD
jgi:hypothetical protein